MRMAWLTLKKSELHRQFRERREFYEREAQRRHLRYDPSGVRARTIDRLAARGVSPAPKRFGDIHTFTFVPRISWHSTLFPDLAELGPVSEFDYAASGYSYGEFLAGDAARRAEMNALAL